VKKSTRQIQSIDLPAAVPQVFQSRSDDLNVAVSFKARIRKAVSLASRQRRLSMGGRNWSRLYVRGVQPPLRDAEIGGVVCPGVETPRSG
jgi:hypothetical protein